jgi:hypothetical protein
MSSRHKRTRLIQGYPLLRAMATTNEHSRDSIISHLNDAGQQRVSDAIKLCLTSSSLVQNYPVEAKLLQEILKPRYKELKGLAYNFKLYKTQKRKNMLLRAGSEISSILMTILPEMSDIILDEDDPKTINNKTKNATTTTTTPTTALTTDKTQSNVDNSKKT